MTDWNVHRCLLIYQAADSRVRGQKHNKSFNARPNAARFKALGHICRFELPCHELLQHTIIASLGVHYFKQIRIPGNQSLLSCFFPIPEDLAYLDELHILMQWADDIHNQRSIRQTVFYGQVNDSWEWLHMFRTSKLLVSFGLPLL